MADKLDELTKQELLELDIDGRMALLREEMFKQFAASGETGMGLEQIEAFMRAAYGKGYVDSVVDARDGEPEKLCKEHGYQVTRDGPRAG